jgi:hypothetical protein
MEEHKNLRREYQRIQAELRSLYQRQQESGLFDKEGVALSSSNQEALKRATQRLRIQVLSLFSHLHFQSHSHSQSYSHSHFTIRETLKNWFLLNTSFV